jgi:hypothetical protein
MQAIEPASVEKQEAHEAANPGWAEGVWQRHQERHARFVADLERHPEKSEYAKLRRRQAKAAGIPVIPMELVRRMKRDPGLALRVSHGRMSLTSFRVLAAGSTSRPARRANGPSGRPRAQATRSSARSGDSPSEDEPDEPPAAALDAVAACWASILHERHPDVSWEVEWLPGHGDVETEATTWRPSLLTRVRDGLNPKLRRF